MTATQLAPAEGADATETPISATFHESIHLNRRQSKKWEYNHIHGPIRHKMGGKCGRFVPHTDVKRVRLNEHLGAWPMRLPDVHANSHYT